MSTRKYRDFYDEADFMYEKDRQEEIDKNEQALRETRSKVSQSYQDLFTNILADLEELKEEYDRFPVPAEDFLADGVEEVLDKYG